ncbi:g6380 [Coccomyxa viridis]|uniref:G6380 protein n=1 Tax=Coccomyxa viridis TaxID=1274662 RepID=A0ABP1FV87_9CHLO
MVDDVVTELGPIQPRGRERLYKPIPATSIVGKGVYVLYYDGSDVRLLTRLCEHDRSAYAEGGRAAFGVYKTGDNVIIVGHDLQRMGVSSYSSKPVPHPALLNRKGFKFMLCGHHIFYGRHGDSPSNIPQSLTQLLDKAAKEDPSPKNLRNDIHNATTQIDKLPMQLAVDLSILETPENGTTKNWPTYRIRLHTGRFTIRNCILKLQLLLFKTCIPEATISPMEEEAYTKGVTCLVSCPMEDAERYCEALRRKGLSSTIELA